MSRYQLVCEIPGLLSRFYLFIYLFIIIIIIYDSDVFYNLGNENELLASMDIVRPVRIEGKKQYK